jgi:hypothetical protein
MTRAEQIAFANAENSRQSLHMHVQKLHELLEAVDATMCNNNEPDPQGSGEAICELIEAAKIAMRRAELAGNYNYRLAVVRGEE